MHIADHRAQQTFDRAAYTRPQQRIHNNLGRGDRGAGASPILLAEDDRQVSALLAPAAEIHRRITSQCLRVRAEQHRGSTSLLFEQPGDHQAVAAVVSLATEHNNLLARESGKFIVEKLRDTSRRRLHQLERGDPVLCAGPAVRFAHLRGGKDFHSGLASLPSLTMGRLPDAGQEMPARITVISSGCSEEPAQTSTAEISDSAMVEIRAWRWRNTSSITRRCPNSSP